MSRSSNRWRSISMKMTSTTTRPAVASTSAIGPSVARRPASPVGGCFSTTTGSGGFCLGASPSFCSSPMTSFTVDCAFSSESDLPTRRTWRIFPVMLCLYCGRSSASALTCEASSQPRPPSTDNANTTVTTTATTPRQPHRPRRATMHLTGTQAAWQPHRPALIEDERSLTWEQFSRTRNRLAHALAGLGIGGGQHAIVYAHNALENLVVGAALRALGAIGVPMNHRLTGEEVAYILDNADATAVFVGDAVLAMAERVRRAARVQHWVTLRAERRTRGQ